MTEVVTSLQNPVVKSAVALQQKKRRDESGLFVAEGVRLAEELIQANWEMEFGLFTGAALQHERSGRVIAEAASRCRMVQVSEPVFAKAAETEHPQGILIAARQRIMPLGQLLTAKFPLLAVIDGVQDPGNLGTLVRTADAAGVDGIIVTQGAADPYSGKALRASMGSLFHLPLAIGAQRKEFSSALRQAGVRLFATALEGGSSYLAADYEGALAIVFGNEGQGVSAELLASADKRLFIPIYGRAESLNVAAAAAVILYEAARQRRSGVSL